MEEAGPSTSGETPARFGNIAIQVNSLSTTGVHTHLCSITWCQCSVITCLKIIVPALSSIRPQIVFASFRWLKLIVSSGTIRGNTVVCYFSSDQRKMEIHSKLPTTAPLCGPAPKDVKLPKLEIPIFNGNVLTWRSFW